MAEIELGQFSVNLRLTFPMAMTVYRTNHFIYFEFKSCTRFIILH